jgi:outer membrane protein assembly factor BamA
MNSHVRTPVGKVCALLGLSLSLVAAAQDAELPPPDVLQAQRAVIGEIRIDNDNVFATDTPEEKGAFFRLGNRLHIKSRPATIRQQLLFKSGDAYDERLLRESERILRANRYLFDAQIVPVGYHDNVVDLEVRTRDVWTFKPSIRYERRGGKQSTGFEFQESNLLGFGKEITVVHADRVDRSTNELRYFDPHVLGSRARVLGSYMANSDGKTRSLFADRPFYSLATRWSAALNVFDSERTDQRYDLGRVQDEFRHREELFQLSGGISSGRPAQPGGFIHRLAAGLTYETDRFAPTLRPRSAALLPEDRALAYPFVAYNVFGDDFETRRNLDQIERTEDFYTGTFFGARLGYADDAYGADRDAAILGINGGTSLESAERIHTLQLSATANGRIEAGTLQNGVLNADTRYYWRVAPRQLLFAQLRGVASEHLDAERQILLGGDNGLRGYPLRYQDGSSSLLFTLEHRVFTKYYLFRLFNLGGAVFFDAGRTWGRGNAPPVGTRTEFGLLKDVGLGLRFGSSRSAFGSVIHVDLAFPLDGDASIDNVQFLVESKSSF